MNWTNNDIKDQSGKVFLVTGANTGLGFETAFELAKKNGHIILAGRNSEKIEAAIKRIKTDFPTARLEAGIVDLSSLQSVKDFANSIRKKHDRLHVLINNAGVMFPPPGLTKDGYELQFGVNYMAHYLLTYELLPILKNTPDSRVVTLSSIAHRNGKIDFDNLNLQKPFDKFREYGQSKVADLIFSIELQRRFTKNGIDCKSIAAHPGISKTELLRTDKPEMIETVPHMSANQGAFSTLYAATEEINGGTYIGPDGEGEMTGFPHFAEISDYAQQESIAQELWLHTEKELGISFL